MVEVLVGTVWDMDTERGPLRLTMEATDMVAMEVTAMARGPLMLRLTMEATDTEATEVTAMARGPLMPRLTMEATDTAAMDMARGLLTLRSLGTTEWEAIEVTSISR